MTLEARNELPLTLRGEPLAQAIDAAPVMVWRSEGTPDHRVFNAAWHRFTGDTSDGGGDTWLVQVHPQDTERCRGILAASAAARAPFTLDYRVHADGGYRWVMDSASPLLRDGRLAGYAGVCIDIHERREQEDRLAESARTLRLTARRRDEFLGVLAHEMRNPLAPIVNAAALLHMMEKDTPRLARIRDIIERQGDALKRLADDLSDMTRLATGRVALRRERVPVQTLIAAAVDSVQDALRHAGHEVDVNAVPDSLVVDADAARIQQSLARLIANAGKFMMQPGTVQIDTSAQAADDDTPALLQIRVTDSGNGIAPDAMPHVFDVWGARENAPPRTIGGLGVGLAIARRIARLHGGDLQAHSEGAGRGASFVLSLPLPA